MPPKRKSTRVEKGSTNKKAKSDVSDLRDGLEWGTVGESSKAPHIAPMLVLSSKTMNGRNKVAGFDIDFTLIGTKSGRKFATGAADWEWLYDCVPDKLRQIHKDGFRVVFFTNQAGIEKLKMKPEEIRKKINSMMEDLDIPILAFVTTGINHYRKPSTAAWDYFVEECNGGVAVDKSQSYYIGDAAGRAKGWAKDKPKDFSCSDRMFAKNIGIDFKTPEEYFLNETPAPFEWRAIDPVEYLKTSKKPTGKAAYHTSKKEMVLMVGPPASGKSSFAKRYFVSHGYEWVNRDTLSTAEKCLKVAKEALKNGKSVVADNTNPSKAARAEFIKAAKAAGAECRCFIMDTPLDLAHHLNQMRQTITESAVRRVPDVAYNMYKKNYEKPEKSEGFTEVNTIEFVPIFDSNKEEVIFKQWT